MKLPQTTTTGLGKKWFLGGDLNKIKDHWEKKGGRPRSPNSFIHFQEFVRDMSMGEIKYLGREWTQANNREGEGFVEERLDRFFASPEGVSQYPQAVVYHVQKQAFDHCLLILEAKSKGPQIAKRFQFDKRLLDLRNFEDVVETTKNSYQAGNLMFQVYEKIKCCRVALLKLRGEQKLNSGAAINRIKGQMEEMQMKGGSGIGMYGI